MMAAQLKPKIALALDPAQVVVLAHALEQLAGQTLESNARWRLLQIENCLLEKPDRELQEP